MTDLYIKPALHKDKDECKCVSGRIKAISRLRADKAVREMYGDVYEKMNIRSLAFRFEIERNVDKNEV